MDEITYAKHEAWRRGILDWKLYPHQRKVYQAIRDVQHRRKIEQTPEDKYVLNISRRWGKSFVLLIVAFEDCLRIPYCEVRYVAQTKDNLEIYTEPMIRTITEDCPPELVPKYYTNKKMLIFPNGSKITFGGADDRSSYERLRGMASHLNIIDEAGTMRDLEYIYRSILAPQLLTTYGITLMASTPPPEPEHPFEELAMEAKTEANYATYTIHDMGDRCTEKLLAWAAKISGGEDTDYYKREFLCQWAVEKATLIIPEWRNKRDDLIVDTSKTKTEFYQYYPKYTAMDMGLATDFTAVVFGYYDFMRAKVVVESEIVLPGSEVTTERLIRMVRDREKKLWEDQEPELRVSDTNLAKESHVRLLHELALNDMYFREPFKESLEAMVNEMRILVGNEGIEVDQGCFQVIGCLDKGVWITRSDKAQLRKKEFARSKSYGHADALAATIYLNRNIDKANNPIPNTLGLDSKTMHINKMPSNKSDIGETFKKLYKINQ